MFTILRVTQVYWMNWMLTKIEHLLSTTKCPFNETMPSANKIFVNLLWWDFWSIENSLNLDPTIWVYQLFDVEIINKIYLFGWIQTSKTGGQPNSDTSFSLWSKR